MTKLSLSSQGKSKAATRGVRWRNVVLLVLTAVVTTACAVAAKNMLDVKFGQAQVRDRTQAQSSVGTEYYRDAKPILDQRCVACHACYDAPCQLQLSSFEGIDRGASHAQVYDASRIFADEPSRLFVDAGSTEAWRKREFFPVLNERNQTPQNNVRASLLHRALDLKRQNPLSGEPLLPDYVRLSTEGGYSCARLEQFDSFADDHPQLGMPYGLPAVSDAQYQTLSKWIREGAKVGLLPALPTGVQRQVARWEQFLNQDPLKAQLMSRYIYEHLFLAHFYFGQSESATRPKHYFRIVRSLTPPGVPIDIIATRRPYDSPGDGSFYYRLWRERATVVAKTHMPYALNDPRMKRWQALFLDNDSQVSNLPSYDPTIAANPFKAFKDIPVDSRYRFMLDEAQFSIMSFIKGPVCRGQVAVNVIRDQFWVFFNNPDHPSVVRGNKLIAQSADVMRMPIEDGSNASPVSVWTTYAGIEKERIRNKEKFLNEEFASGQQAITLDLIWQGDKRNKNAALTVFRHADNATVLKGLIGAQPETAWVIGYPLLERIHYLLAAGYDVYGNVGHNVNSRLYMDFLRMEGEFSFLAFLPRHVRATERDRWYRDAQEDVVDFIRFDRDYFNAPSGVQYQTDEPKRELLDQITRHLNPVLDRSHDLASLQMPQVHLRHLYKLASLKGAALSFLPEFAYLTVVNGDKSHTLSMVRNTALANVAHLFGEADRRRPDEDTLTVTPGFIGSYPNAFFKVDVSQLAEFVSAVQRLDSEQAYRELARRFAVRRTNPKFWAHSDLVHQHFQTDRPLEFGILDYNRLENR